MIDARLNARDRGLARGLSGACDRRTFVVGAGAISLAGFGWRSGQAGNGQGPLYFSCRADNGSRHVLSAFEATGRVHLDIPLPGRGHSMAFRAGHPHGVVFARRPGTFAVVFDYHHAIVLRRLDADQGRHFYGHGAFSGDGRYLFTAENDYATGRGVIGIRDATDGYRQIGEIPSYGIGPHEVRLMPGGRTLAVANGGIQTRPETGRAKLNIDSMQPSLIFIDVETGGRMDAYRLGARLHKLSIRHLDVAADGRVALAMQYEGPKRDRVPLVGLFDQGGLRLFRAPERMERRMRLYAASIAFDIDGDVLAMSCPRGNLVTFWQAASGALVGHAALPDASGVAPTGKPGEFLLTGAGGRLARFAVGSGELVPLTRFTIGDWDNHAAALV